MNNGTVIVGGGLAAQRCAETLRREGYGNPIRVVCAESHRPYTRPPLSKELLAGAERERTVSFRAPEWYDDQSIDLLLGIRAVGLLPAERRVLIAGGATLRYDWLLIATGSRPRPLPLLAGYENVSELRTLDDARILREVLATRPHIAVIGAGFIGQEVAASARKLGSEVTMIEAAPCPLAAVLGPELGGWFAELHRHEGVTVLTDRTVARAEGNGKVTALHLSDGTALTPDHVVVGIGVEPELNWLRNDDLQTPAGIPVDRDGRTKVSRVLAAGDVAATYDPLLARHVPGSHWEAAGRQGSRAARVILGRDPGPAAATSFWTDQYGMRIQYLGSAARADAVSLDGDPASRSFIAAFTRAGRPVGALLVNRPRELPAMRKLIDKENHDLPD